MFNKPSVKSALILGLIAGTASMPTWAAIHNSLRGIQLNSTPVETRVTLRSDIKIPYRIVTQGSEKIVVDFSAIDPTQSVQTDFADADNIEQVVLKPLASDKIRMVIRGEHLGPAVIQFSDGMAEKMSEAQIVMEQESSAAPAKKSKVKAPDENGFMLTAVEDEKKSADSASQTPVSHSSDETAIFEESGNGEPLLKNETLDIDAQSLPDEFGIDRKSLVDSDGSRSKTANDDGEETTWQDLFVNGFESMAAFAQKSTGGENNGGLFGICAAGGIFVLLALFIHSKLRRSSRRGLQYMDDMDEDAIGLGRLSDGKPRKASRQRYMDDEDMGAAPHPHRGADRPVGLRSLGFQDIPSQDNPIRPASKNLLNANQARQQYAQQAQAPMSEPMRRDRREIDRELKRSIQVRQNTERTHTRKPFTGNAGTQPPAKPQAKMPPSNPQQSRPASRQGYPAASASARNQSPMARPQKAAPRQPQPAPSRRHEEPGLPANNNEVLEFLRSVADLMEKDGRSDLAQGVKRSINRPTRH